MYLVFPPAYSGLADAVFTQARSEYQYGQAVQDKGLDEGLINSYVLSVAEYDRDEARNSQDVAEYRWSILKAMAQGAVFVNYENNSGPIDEAHFFTTDKSLPMEEQIKSILVAGRYAESRAKYFAEVSPKVFYAGPTYVNPIAAIVTSYDSKQESYSVDYDPKIRNILSSLPEDLWTKTTFLTSRMSSTLHHLLDVLPETAILAFDKRVVKKVESYEYTQLTAPKQIDLEFGIEINNLVKRKEVEEEE